MSQHDFKVCTTPIETGLTLIEAAAGTGKTYSLVRVIAREVVELDIPIEQILTVTFTRAATAEIKERLHALLNEISSHLKQPGLEKGKCNDLVWHWRQHHPEIYAAAPTRVAIALANFDRAPVFTIDGFFQRLLKESAFEANTLFSTELVTDEADFINTALRDYWREHVYPKSPTELDFFQNTIQFGHAREFVGKALHHNNASFDPAYQIPPDSLTQNYRTAWKRCVPLLKQHAEALMEFVRTLPGGLTKRGHPFSAGGPEKLASAIEQILNRPQTIPSSISIFSRLTSSYLSNPTSYKKTGDPELIQCHPLMPLFEALDELLHSQPQGLESAYLGEILKFCQQRVQQLKQNQNVQGYSDVTATLADMLRQQTPASLAVQKNTGKRYQACLIDEFQDTSPDQCQVFLSLFHSNDRYFHIVGDPKQSIYRFRGADVFSYLKAKEEKDQAYQLRTNYRSTANMVQAVNTFFSLSRSKDPFLTDKKIEFTPSLWKDPENTPEPDQAALHIHHLTGDLNKNKEVANKAIAKHICSQIHQLIDHPWSSLCPGKKGLIHPSDIAILVRSGNQGSNIHAELCRQNIPATLNTQSSLMESEEAGQMHTLLSAMLEPRRPKLLRAALLSPPLGSGRLLNPNNQEKFDQTSQQAAELHTLWHGHGLMPMMLECIRRFDIRTTLLQLPQGQRRVTNFLHLTELLDEKARQQKFNPAGILHWFEMALQNQTDEVIDNKALELRISTDDDAVQLLTQHACKGLEFPIVFALSPCSNQLTSKHVSRTYHAPDTFALHYASMENDAQPPEVIEARTQEEHADAIRLAYVALTRSAHLCHFYLPAPKKEPADHSIYRMLELESPEELSEACQTPGSCIQTSQIDSSVLDTFQRYQAPQKSETTELTVRASDAIQISQPHHTTSFTGITRNAPEIIHDFDENTNSPETSAPSEKFWSQLQGGAALGLVFHEVLELTDFKQPDQLQQTISQKLDQHRPWHTQPDNLSELIDEIARSIRQWLTHPLDNSDSPVTLDQLSNAQRINESEFLLTGSHFSLPALCDILASAPPEHLPQHYIQQLRQMPASRLDGFLTGFIDLIFEHKGRYHLLDWKTNRIPDPSPPSLANVMAEHHYYLQYHLYSLALDRFLAQRLPNYDPARHLGKIHYVFFRGIQPDTPGSGVFTDELSTGRLEALRQAFAPRLTYA